MRFLSIYRPTASEEGGAPTPEHMAEMGQLTETWMAKGALLGVEPLTPRDACARVTLSGGAYTVTPEEVRAGGYAVLQAASKEEAIELCKIFLKTAGDGTCELRQILEFAPQPG